MKFNYLLLFQIILLPSILLGAGAGAKPYGQIIADDDVQAMAQFLTRNADQDINALNYYGKPLLLDAAGQGASNIVELLLMRGANPEIVDALGNTVWHYAVEGDDSHKAFKVVGMLIGQQVPGVNRPNSQGETPLAAAALNSSIAWHLLKYGADVNAPADAAGRSIFQVIKQYRDQEIIDYGKYKALKALFERYRAKAEQEKKGS